MKVFLPKTNFKMRGNLGEKEPKILEFWERIDLYEKLQENSNKKKKFILHFGPPYANGHIHIGHALSEVLKDIVVKTFYKSGYNAPLVPGWDCHGLPIGWKVEEEYRKNNLDIRQNKQKFLKSCREFASNWIKIQKDEFKRLGILANFKNPYITMKSSYEASTLKKLYEFLMSGILYQGLKPVLWSVVEKTALAEAEVEYQDHESDSVYVAFPIKACENKNLIGADIVIWTTTPWTLPCNKAVCYGKNFEYALLKVQINGKTKNLIVAKKCIDDFIFKIKAEKYEVIKIFNGEILKGAICEHPLNGKGYEINIPLIEGDHVTTETGTGLVHTAPSHGLDDFYVCKKFNIDITNYVMEDGVYSKNTPLFAGKYIFDVAPFIMKELGENLLHHSKITHSYPHSWRSRSPLIYMATQQWFVNLNNIKEKALDVIKNDVKWFPKQGEGRISSMVEDRSEWCLSRQKIWGVPLAFFINKSTKKPIKDDAVNKRVLKAIEEEGIEAWYKYDEEYFLEGLYDSTMYSKFYDIADVWFDSGCSYSAVLQERSDLKFPSDVYLEGSDQHRGWFQSSLLISLLTDGVAPYKNVVTHGFVLDEKGKKMSKSLGNVISPQEVMKKMGADIIRLWIVNSDYREDIKLGNEILESQKEYYRKYRNTIRYLLGALYEFDDSEKLEYEELPSLEKLILSELYRLNKLHEESKKSFYLQPFYSALHNFCVTDLSAFYFEIRKDSLYCDAKNNKVRMGYRTVINQIFMYLLNWLSPVLSFTTEEAYQYYLGLDDSFEKSKKSVHELLFNNPESFWDNEEIKKEWKAIKDLRAKTTKIIEEKRSEGEIGSSLQADIEITVDNKGLFNILKKYSLSEIMIVSKAEVKLDEDMESVQITVKKAEGKKCDRCWKIVDSIIKLEDNDVCKRCFDVENSSSLTY